MGFLVGEKNHIFQVALASEANALAAAFASVGTAAGGGDP